MSSQPKSEDKSDKAGEGSSDKRQEEAHIPVSQVELEQTAKEQLLLKTKFHLPTLLTNAARLEKYADSFGGLETRLRKSEAAILALRTFAGQGLLTQDELKSNLDLVKREVEMKVEQRIQRALLMTVGKIDQKLEKEEWEEGMKVKINARDVYRELRNIEDKIITERFEIFNHIQKHVTILEKKIEQGSSFLPLFQELQKELCQKADMNIFSSLQERVNKLETILNDNEDDEDEAEDVEVVSRQSMTFSDSEGPLSQQSIKSPHEVQTKSNLKAQTNTNLEAYDKVSPDPIVRSNSFKKIIKIPVIEERDDESKGPTPDTNQKPQMNESPKIKIDQFSNKKVEIVSQFKKDSNTPPLYKEKSETEPLEAIPLALKLQKTGTDLSAIEKIPSGSIKDVDNQKSKAAVEYYQNFENRMSMQSSSSHTKKSAVQKHYILKKFAEDSINGLKSQIADLNKRLDDVTTNLNTTRSQHDQLGKMNKKLSEQVSKASSHFELVSSKKALYDEYVKGPIQKMEAIKVKLEKDIDALKTNFKEDVNYKMSKVLGMESEFLKLRQLIAQERKDMEAKRNEVSGLMDKIPQLEVITNTVAQNQASVDFLLNEYSMSKEQKKQAEIKIPQVPPTIGALKFREGQEIFDSSGSQAKHMLSGYQRELERAQQINKEILKEFMVVLDSKKNFLAGNTHYRMQSSYTSMKPLNRSGGFSVNVSPTRFDHLLQPLSRQTQFSRGVFSSGERSEEPRKKANASPRLSVAQKQAEIEARRPTQMQIDAIEKKQQKLLKDYQKSQQQQSRTTKGKLSESVQKLKNETSKRRKEVISKKTNPAPLKVSMQDTFETSKGIENITTHQMSKEPIPNITVADRSPGLESMRQINESSFSGLSDGDSL